MDDGALSLHFELREGGYADLETAGLAAIAFARAVKAAARAIDPNAVVQIKLVDADQGSLTWNTLVDWIERHVEPQLERIERGGQQIKRTRKIAIALAVPILHISATDSRIKIAATSRKCLSGLGKTRRLNRQDRISTKRLNRNPRLRK